MTSFVRTAGEINRQVRIVRELVKERLREPEHGQVLVALAFIEGVAWSLTSHDDVRPENKQEKPARSRPAQTP